MRNANWHIETRRWRVEKAQRAARAKAKRLVGEGKDDPHEKCELAYRDTPVACRESVAQRAARAKAQRLVGEGKDDPMRNANWHIETRRWRVEKA